LKAVVKVEPKPGVEVRDVEAPTPRRHEVLIRVRAAAICGSDVSFHDYTPAYQGFAKIPCILGHEYAGEVAEVGERVSSFKPGDRVVGESILFCGKCFNCRDGRTNICSSFRILGIQADGAFAEYASVPARIVHSLPGAISFHEAAVIEPLSVTVHALNDVSRVQSEDVVVVLGPGPIGLFAAQAARSLGAGKVLVAGIGVDMDRLGIAERLGLQTMNVEREDPLKWVAENTQGRGADLVVVAVGAQQAINQAIRMARKGGQVTLIGLFTKPPEVPLLEVVRNEIRVQGNLGARWASYEQAIRLLARGVVDAKPLVTHRFPLEEASIAFSLAKSKTGCKIEFLPS